MPKSVKAISPSSDGVVDPDHAVLELHFDSDFEQPVLVFAKLLGDAADRLDVMDFVDVHGQSNT